MSEDRDSDGKFLPGVSGNPKGRPPGRRAQIDILKQDLEIAVRGGLKAERISKILNKMCDLAEKGDVKAAKLVLSIAISAAGVQKDAIEGGGGITFRIENATFAANKERAVEAQVIEVKQDAD